MQVLFRCGLTSLNCSTCVTGGIPYSRAFFGVGTGPIYLDYVACTSSDSQLLECYSRPISSHNCLHSADAGVGCEGIILKPFKYCNKNQPYILLQLHAKLVKYDWLEAMFPMRAEWRSVWTMCGGLCVMTPGAVLMPLLCVDS